MSSPEPRYRHELKYLVSAAQIPLLKSRIEQIMQLDPHGGKDGMYSIRSLYFDDYRNRSFHENENGTEPREKFRIRIYNRSLQRIALECKRKDHGKTLKTACLLTREQAECLMQGKPVPEWDGMPPLLRKMNLQIRTRLLRPVVTVEYERIPYLYPNGNVRVTLDMNISAGPGSRAFLTDHLPRRPVMPLGQHLLEVKFDEYLPDVIYRSLNLGCLRQTTCSKFYLSRKTTLHR